MSKIVSDRISFSDTGVPISPVNPGLWAWTEVIGGYGDIIHNPRGKSTIGEECFRTHNIVPISGVSTVMSKLFEVQEVGESTIKYPTLADHGIGAPDGDIGNGPSYNIPNISRSSSSGTSGLTVEKKMIFPAGHGIIGFCIGNTGSAESDISVYKPEYNDCKMELSRVISGKTVTGEIIPFRYTAEDLNPTEQAKYFGKKTLDTGLTAYYLKRFEQDPVIKHVWVDGTEIDEDTEEKIVTNADLWNTNIGGVNTISSFTEIILKISKKDVKEWFNVMGQEDRARMNTIALFSGDFVAGYNPDTANPQKICVGDYRNCRLFSKLIINPEYLNIAKDLSIIYRVYGS